MNLSDWLAQQKDLFLPVVPLAPGDGIAKLDFTTANPLLTDAVLADTGLFSAYVNNVLQQHGARYGIGGYGEHRSIYRRSPVFNGAEPRRLHLGTDVWGAAATAVLAPFAGRVHSFANNPAFGDYGGTIILQHTWQKGVFHTLYGHLNLASLHSLNCDAEAKAGQAFAAFGLPAENGQWPPHLHFQIIEDMQGRRGDYPGVCRFSERSAFLANCPDADLILNLNRFAK